MAASSPSTSCVRCPESATSGSRHFARPCSHDEVGHMAAGASRKAGLIRWSRDGLAAATDRSKAWAGALGRRPHHVAMAALATGIAAAAAPRWVIPAAGVLVLAIGAAAVRSAPPARTLTLAALAVAALAAGGALGAWRLTSIDTLASRAGPDGAPLSGTAILLEHPRPSLFGSSAAIRLTSGRVAGATVLGRLDGPQPWPAGGEAGAILRVAGTAQRPKAGGSFEWRAYLRRRGIAFELAIDSLGDTGRRRGGLSGAIDSMRVRAKAALGARITVAKAALARGMVLGQDELIDPLERDDFRRSGLAHVLAVSGQNVMLLCALALPLLGRLGAGPRVRVGVLLGLIAVYVPLAGAGPSLQRAGVMGAAGLVALAAGRAASRWYALELAAVATLALNPRVAGDAGWQLSFAAVIGILVLSPPLQSAFRGMPRVLAEGAAVTLAATVATAPLIAHSFGSVSVAGVGANLAALPVVAGVMWAGMIKAALAQLPDVLAAPPLAIHAIGLLSGALLGIVRAIVRYFADAPGATVVLPLGSRAAVGLAYLLTGLVATGLRRAARKVEPSITSGRAAWRRTNFRHRAVTVALAGAVLGLAWTTATARPAPPGR